MLNSTMTRNLTDFEICKQFCVPPCPACRKIIKDNDKAVQCYKSCKRWFHTQCINLRFSVYVKFEDKIKLRWSCEREDCKSGASESGDDVDEWPIDKGVELLIPSKDHFLVLPGNSEFPKYKTEDVTAIAWKDEITKRLKAQGFYKETDLINKKDVSKSIVASDMVQSLNKSLKKTRRKKKPNSSRQTEPAKNVIPQSNTKKSKPSEDNGENKITDTLSTLQDTCRILEVNQQQYVTIKKSDINPQIKHKITSLEEMDNMEVKPFKMKTRPDPMSLSKLRLKKYSLDQINNMKSVTKKRSSPERSEHRNKESKKNHRVSDQLPKILKPILKKTSYFYESQQPVEVKEEEVKDQLRYLEEKEYNYKACNDENLDDLVIEEMEFDYQLDSDGPPLRPITPDSNDQDGDHVSIVDKIFSLEQEEAYPEKNSEDKPVSLEHKEDVYLKDKEKPLFLEQPDNSLKLKKRLNIHEMENIYKRPTRRNLRLNNLAGDSNN